MKFKFSQLFLPEGTIDRGPYFLIGVIGFAIKHNLDRIVATAYFKKPWNLFNYYISPGHITSLPPEDARMFLTLLVLALPFIWIGVSLTLQRLRAIGWPLWLVVFFFVPFGNLVFFLLLSLIPSQPLATASAPRAAPHGVFAKLIPTNSFGNAAMAVGITLFFGLAMTLLGSEIFQKYGWGLFVGVPFVMGVMSALLEGYHRPQPLYRCTGVAIISVFLLSFLLLALAFEGVMCIAMAGPLALILAVLGALVGYGIQRRPENSSKIQTALWILILLTPAGLTAEQSLPIEAPLFTHITSIEIDAPPEKVLRSVVGFTEIPPPTEWFFRWGIAYPVRAKLDGHGVGALRHCVFSTGEFLEPIEVWEEPRLLKFSVRSQPAPMEEWTPYPEIHPAHLDNYLRSTGGQFLLTPLPGGRTKVEATTWYHHTMWPARYWQLWSDAIIHRIHERVLGHIKADVEQNGG